MLRGFISQIERTEYLLDDSVQKEVWVSVDAVRRPVSRLLAFRIRQLGV
jgi:hypothetical protein